MFTSFVPLPQREDVVFSLLAEELLCFPPQMKGFLSSFIDSNRNADGCEDENREDHRVPFISPVLA